VTSRNRSLRALAALALIVAAIAFIVARPVSESETLPRTAPELAKRLAAHPTDWRAASALSEISLDTRLERKHELWIASHQLAQLLAPARNEPQTGFARSGFFHWAELSASDQKAVLEAFAPQLETPAFFGMARPLFALTGDLGILRNHHPNTDEAVETLESIAATNGRFDDYRALRDQVTQRRVATFLARVGSMSSSEIINALPPAPYHTDLQPIISAALTELSEKPLSENPGRPDVTEPLADYALRHDLKPLDGLEALTRFHDTATEATRAALARKLGFEKRAGDVEASMFPAKTPVKDAWSGSCSGDVCVRGWRDVVVTKSLIVVVTPDQMDDVPPYVEIYLDDQRVAEDAVATSRRFAIAAQPGTHRLEVMVVNPVTRNRAARRVRVSVPAG
jgi:hypothetical protein